MSTDFNGRVLKMGVTFCLNQLVALHIMEDTFESDSNLPELNLSPLR